MKLESTSDIKEEIRPAFDLLRYQSAYQGTLIGDFLNYFLEKRRSPDEEKAMYYGVQAMINTMRNPNRVPKEELVDVNRTMQALKMKRKGFQNDLHRKELEWKREEEELRAAADILKEEWRELSEKRNAFLEEEMINQVRQAVKRSGKGEAQEETDRLSGRDPQIEEFEKEKRTYRILEVVFPAVCLLIALFAIPYPWRMLMILPGMAGEFWILASNRRVVNERKDYEDRKVLRIKKAEEIRRKREEIEERMVFKKRKMEKLRREYRRFVLKTEERQPEQEEIDALTLAIEEISRMAGISERG